MWKLVALCSAPLAFCWITGGATAQVIEAKFALSPGVSLDRQYETSIAVSRTTPTHLIVACKHQSWAPTNVARVRYGITRTAGQPIPTWSEGGLLPVPIGLSPVDFWTDPMTAASPTSDTLWVGCLLGNRGGQNTFKLGLAVWPNEAGTGTLKLEAVATMGPQHYDDKPLLAAGPRPAPHGTEPFLYAAFTRRDDIECNAVLNNHFRPPATFTMWRRWDAAQPATSGASVPARIDPTGEPFWPEGATFVPPGYSRECDRYGFGAAPLIIPSGPNRGRLVVAFAIGKANISLEWLIEVCHLNEPQDGVSAGWGPGIRMNQSAGGEDIHGFNPDKSIPGKLVMSNFPYIAMDPHDPDLVYVSFVGCPEPYEASADRNVDIYIAKSINGGATFLAQNILRITDSMLQTDGVPDPVGTDQFYPAIAIDAFGGINIAYIRTEPGQDQINPPTMDVRYARLASFPPGSQIQSRALTPPFLCPHDPGDPTGDGRQLIGEYISIATSGCFVYPAYFQTEAESGEVVTNVYVSRISLCPADTNTDGMVTEGDPGAFAVQYAAQAPRADLNQDGVCNALDIERLVNCYACGCPGTP